VIGSFFGSAQDMRNLLALAHKHAIRPQVERYELETVNAAHDRLRANGVRYRAVIEL
jgi:D-arabinose 1-dehydrogenase-like Zn-dependent alcohol dehydrogenase